MIAGNVFNNNSTRGGATGVMNYAGNPQAITTAGQYCPIIATFPSIIDSVYYVIQAGAGVSAVIVGIQLLLAFEPNGTQTWVTATTPNSATATSFNLINGTAPGIYNGSLNVSGGIFAPINGIRLNVATLTGGNITYAQLSGTVR